MARGVRRHALHSYGPESNGASDDVAHYLLLVYLLHGEQPRFLPQAFLSASLSSLQGQRIP